MTPSPGEPEVVKILVVDDHPENIFALRASLSRPDYDIVEARSGEEALKRVLQHDFAVILLDVLMPRMDGFEAATLIRERHASRHIPILFLTATSSESHLVYKGYSVGAVDYLVKPISPDIVKAKVSVFVELYRKERRIQAQERALREAERQRGDHRQRFLAAASECLLGSFEAERQLRDLAELATQSVAEWCLIWVAPEGNAEVHEVAAVARQPPLSPGLEALREWAERRIEAGLVDDHPEVAEPKANRTARELAPFGVASVMRLPLVLRGRRFGQLVLATRAEDREPFDGSDLVMAEDLAHRIALAQENTRLYREARDAVQARDEFLSIASHELRTPLTPLQIDFHRFLGVHAKVPPETLPSSQLRMTLARSERSVQRLITLVDKLLDVSRISGGVLELEHEELDLVELIREVASRFTEELVRAGSELNLDLAGPAVGSWDRLRIDQVLSNLLSNAAKYGAGNPIHISLETAGEEIRVLVRDEGIGIDPEGRRRIFGRFERAVSPRAYGGLGLGLYIARQIAEAHGGSIEVTSEPGAGSLFVLCLPTRPPDEAARRPLENGYGVPHGA